LFIVAKKKMSHWHTARMYMKLSKFEETLNEWRNLQANKKIDVGRVCVHNTAGCNYSITVLYVTYRHFCVKCPYQMGTC
jgi:hypothetical protein